AWRRSRTRAGSRSSWTTRTSPARWRASSTRPAPWRCARTGASSRSSDAAGAAAPGSAPRRGAAPPPPPPPQPPPGPTPPPDNPRTEDPAAIVEEIRVGVLAAGGDATVLVDRREAIREALHRARPGDVVLLAGKGHETYQEIAGVKHPFDDREVAREMLAGVLPRGWARTPSRRSPAA